MIVIKKKKLEKLEIEIVNAFFFYIIYKVF